MVVAISREGKPGLVRDAYEWTHEHFPNLMDCRPIYARRSVLDAGFVVTKARVGTCGFQSRSYSRSTRNVLPGKHPRFQNALDLGRPEASEIFPANEPVPGPIRVSAPNLLRHARADYLRGRELVG